MNEEYNEELADKIIRYYELQKEITNYPGKNVKKTKIYREFTSIDKEVIDAINIVEMCRKDSRLADMCAENSNKFKKSQEIAFLRLGPLRNW